MFSLKDDEDFFIRKEELTIISKKFDIKVFHFILKNAVIPKRNRKTTKIEAPTLFKYRINGEEIIFPKIPSEP